MHFYLLKTLRRNLSKKEVIYLEEKLLYNRVKRTPCRLNQKNRFRLNWILKELSYYITTVKINGNGFLKQTVKNVLFDKKENRKKKYCLLTERTEGKCNAYETV